MIECRIHFFLERYLHPDCTGHIRTLRGQADFCRVIAGIERAIGQQVEVGLDLLPVERQYLQGYPEMRRRHGDQEGDSIALELAARPGSGGIVFGGHENRAGLGIDEQVSADIVIDEKAVLSRPVQHLSPAASQHCDVERFDLYLLEHLRGVSSPGRGRSRSWCKAEGLGMGFAKETLQRPAAARFDLERHCREGYYPPQVSGIALVGEAGEIALDAVVPGDQCGGTRQPYIAIGRKQPSASEGRNGLDCAHREGDDDSYKLFVQHEHVWILLDLCLTSLSV